MQLVQLLPVLQQLVVPGTSSRSTYEVSLKFAPFAQENDEYLAAAAFNQLYLLIARLPYLPLLCLGTLLELVWCVSWLYYAPHNYHCNSCWQ